MGLRSITAGSGSGGGQLLGRCRSFVLWDNSGSGKNLGGAYSWLGDPVDNNPMHNIVIDHDTYPNVLFNVFATMTEDGTTSLGIFEFQIWDETNDRLVMWQPTLLAGAQWRGIPAASRIHRAPGAGIVSYRLHAKTSIGGHEVRGAKVDTGAYLTDYEQVCGFEAVAA